MRLGHKDRAKLAALSLNQGIVGSHNPPAKHSVQHTAMCNKGWWKGRKGRKKEIMRIKRLIKSGTGILQVPSIG